MAAVVGPTNGTCSIYDLPETYGKENLDGVVTLDFRPMSNFDGSNAPAENNDRILYYDDFEFLK